MRNVVILGMHRSGTSMVAEALASGGIYVGEPEDLLRGQEDNPHGFWEREDVVALDDVVLSVAGGSWYRPPAQITVSPAHRDAVAALVAGMPADRSWLIKDPRQVLTWPVWQDAVAEAVLVFVYRAPLPVAASLQRRNGFPLSLGLALWEFYNRQAVAALQGRDTICLSYEEVAADPQRTLSRLMDQLAGYGVSCKRQLDPGIFDDSLGRSRAGNDAVALSLLSPSQQELAVYCEALCAGGELPSPPAEDATLWARLEDMGAAMAPLATVLETRTELREMTELCDERTRERDESLGQFRQLENEHDALVDAHQQEQSLHHRLEAIYQDLDREHPELAGAHHAQVAENTALREQAALLNRTFGNLLQFELSTLARLSRLTAWCYKLLTLRRSYQSSYDNSLADARAYFEREGLQIPQKPPGRLALLGDVARYVFENPAGSARSFSLARLKRALTVFARSSPDDLEVWVNSRFPERESAGEVLAAAQLDQELDVLEMVFPDVSEPLVSIIVPVYNDYRMTKHCLRAILDNSGDIPYEVVIADDCSTDLTASIGERVANIKVVRGDENLRFLGNCNRAASVASGKYLLFLNNDTAVCPDWLQPLLDVVENDPGVGIVGPKLLFADGKLQEAGAIMWQDGSAWNFGRMDDPEKPEYNYLKATDYISGACLLIRGDLWQQLGGFDTRYAPAYYEDADIAFAAREAGYQVIYQPLSRVFHFEGVSNGTDLTAGVKQYQVQNQVKFREKWAAQLDAFHFPNAQHVFQARDRSRDQRSVLIIDHYVPHYDKDAGSRSTFMYIQLMLEMGYKVLFLGANYFPHKPYTATLQQMGVEVLVGEYMARNQDRWLRDNAQYIDTIYLHRPHVAEQFLGSLERMTPRPPVIFFGHDLHYLRIGREQEVVGDESLGRTADRWREREYAVFGRVNKIYYPSQVEVDAILAHSPGLDVRAIPLYALDETPGAPYAFEQTADILFVGGFNHPPNVDGICWFVEQVLPQVAAACPAIRLHVVGSNPTDAVEALQSELVNVYGYLPDDELDALYRRVRQVIVPLRFGAGVKGKVLEAIQKNLPLVTTPVGAEGIPEAEAVMNIADNAEEFASIVAAIDRGESSRLQRLQAYPGWLKRHFSKSRAAQILCEDFGPPRRAAASPEQDSPRATQAAGMQ